MFSSSTTCRGSNSRPPDHDSTLHVTETPSLTTRPSVTSLAIEFAERKENNNTKYSTKSRKTIKDSDDVIRIF